MSSILASSCEVKKREMPVADIVLKNANILNMDAPGPSAELVVITGDRIMLVGGNAEGESAIGAGTRVIDCAGRTVVPGFDDAHYHLFSFVRSLLSIDLSPRSVRSVDEIKVAIRKRAESTPPGTWLSGTGLNEFYLPGQRCPTRQDIDEAAPDHPVVVSHRSLHACILNSLALSLAGISIETPDPPGGMIDRDLATGEPNGILFEMLGYIREKVMPPLSDAEFREAMVMADRHLLSKGITSLQDATVRNDRSRWELLRSFINEGMLNTRVTMMIGEEARAGFQKAGMTTGSGDEHLRLGAVKVMLSEATGQLQPPQAELNSLALDCHNAGFQLAFHAIEESTVAAAVTALEYVRERSPIVGRRHRIEHCAECPPYLLDRLAAAGAVIVTQPPFIYYSGERYLATVAESQLPWLYRVRSPVGRGLTVAGSSDSPVVPDNPLVAICAAVTRRAESGQYLLPEERVSPEEAIAMYTRNAAYASFEENLKGSISPGKLADMVVLSADPNRIPPEAIKDIRVEMTIIGGRVVWEA